MPLRGRWPSRQSGGRCLWWGMEVWEVGSGVQGQLLHADPASALALFYLPYFFRVEGVLEDSAYTLFSPLKRDHL